MACHPHDPGTGVLVPFVILTSTQSYRCGTTVGRILDVPVPPLCVVTQPVPGSKGPRPRVSQYLGRTDYHSVEGFRDLRGVNLQDPKFGSGRVVLSGKVKGVPCPGGYT